MERFFHKSTVPTTFTKKEKEKIGKKIFKGEKALFFLILVLFPNHLAKRYILSFAYVQGILVDYLLPTVSLTELLVISLFFFTTLRLLLTSRLKPKKLLPLLLLLPLLPSFLVSQSLLSSVFRFIEIALWGSFALWIKENISWEKDQQSVTKALSFGVCWVALLALAQFLVQRNIFGYWFLGEPTLYPSLGGVAKASFFGREVLRAYGTFPHPNVLGGILSVLLPWILLDRRFIPAFVGLGGLVVSFSRLSWLSFLIGIVVLGFLQAKRSLRFIVVLLSLPFLLVVTQHLISSFSDDLSVVRRVELLQSAWVMIQSAPFSGIGLGLFTAKLPAFGLPAGPTLFLQPVHNIFALVAAESGLLALAVFLSIFVLTAWEAWRKRRLVLLISLSQLIFLGFFDHYLYTLPQGLFLLFLTLGFIFSYAKGDGRPAHP